MNKVVLLLVIIILFAKANTNQREKVAFGTANNWKQDTDGKGIYIEVDTRKAKFQKKPMYFTSISGTGAHYALLGTESLYNATKDGFRIHLRYPGSRVPTVEEAKDKKWTLHWMGVEENTDEIQTISTNNWLKYPNPANERYYAWVKVTTSMSGYLYFASIEGDSHHETSVGTPAIYYRNDGFEVYAYKDGALEQAKKYNWRLNFLKLKTGGKRFITGSTRNWKADSTGKGIYVDVEFNNPEGFKRTPMIFTSVYGTSAHCILTGIASINNPTTKGFRVYVHDVRGVQITPSFADSYKWELVWMAVEPPEPEKKVQKKPKAPKAPKKIKKSRKKTTVASEDSVEELINLIEQSVISPDNFVEKPAFNEMQGKFNNMESKLNEMEGKTGFHLKNKQPLDLYSDLVQIQAQSACLALSPGNGHIYAVSRECSNTAPSCKEVCEKVYCDYAKKHTTCYDALHIYKDTGISKPYERGLKTYIYKSCEGRFCGPNYCCCRAA